MAAVLTYHLGTLVLRCAESLPSPVRDLLSELGFVDDARIHALRGPAAAYREAALLLSRNGGVDEARGFSRWSGDILRSRVEPYPHQREAMDAWWDEGGRGIVVLPTGTGKTFLALMAMTRVARDTLIVVPTLDLMAQWVAVLRGRFDLPVGMIGGGEHDLQPITVITYDSAARKVDRIGDRFGMLIFDECHHLGGPIYQAIAEQSLAPFRLGLTATLERPDGGHQQIIERIGPVAYFAPVKELSGTVLAPYHTVRMEVELTEDEGLRYEEAREVYLEFCRRNRIFMGRPQGWARFLQLAFRSPEGKKAWECYRIQKEIPLTSTHKENALEGLLLQHRGDRILIFTHVNEVAYRISRRHLLPTITHQTPPGERVRILARFGAGEYRAVVTSKVLNEGVDVPEASVAIVVSGSASQREHIQRLGRVLRKGSGGKRAVLYELVTSGTHEEGMSQRRRNREYF
ncbi:MAG: DEAD/DEAH box helicase [Pseudomonadota bacterium]